jgi:hypothetical protein
MTQYRGIEYAVIEGVELGLELVGLGCWRTDHGARTEQVGGKKDTAQPD